MNDFQKLYYADDSERLEYVGICNFCEKDIFLTWNEICVGITDETSYHVTCYHMMIYKEGG